MRAALAVAFLVVPAAVSACEKLEYAEMDAMKREELLVLRCQYDRQMYELIAAARPAQDLRAAQYAVGQSNRCAIELGRMDRILARKYGLAGSEAEIIRGVSGMCPKK